MNYQYQLQSRPQFDHRQQHWLLQQVCRLFWELGDPQVEETDGADDDDDSDGDEHQVQINADQLQMGEEKNEEYHRLNNLCARKKSYIKDKKAKITELLNEDHSLLMDAERRDKKIKVKTAIEPVF